ncbi:MAG: DUF2786 domain-containing protein [Proteobacteria bacterium]|nr:DUF2786 domain-containing protein [Pseudomonadota bacterium]
MIEMIEREWVQQLYQDHKEISWYHKLNLGPVIIQLSDSISRWGEWDSFFKCIKISRKLILEHSWDVVLEILKHEMAHQYVSEKWPDLTEFAHGPRFKEACSRLGVASWASEAAGEIPKVVPNLKNRVVCDEDKRLLSRVEKLLALAQSTNEYEALLAMQRVRELYAKHDIDTIMSKRKRDEFDSLFVTSKKKKMGRTESKILAILSDHFNVRIVQTQLFDARDCTRYRAAEILGRREHVLMAEYVFHFLMQQSHSLWVNHKNKTKCHGSLRSSFQLGILCGFDEKLKKLTIDIQANLVSHANLKSLQKIERNEMQDFVAQRYPRLVKKSIGSGRVDSGTFASGRTEGQKINLNKPVSTSRHFGGLIAST